MKRSHLSDNLFTKKVKVTTLCYLEIVVEILSAVPGSFTVFSNLFSRDLLHLAACSKSINTCLYDIVCKRVVFKCRAEYERQFVHYKPCRVIIPPWLLVLSKWAHGFHVPNNVTHVHIRGKPGSQSSLPTLVLPDSVVEARFDVIPEVALIGDAKFWRPKLVTPKLTGLRSLIVGCETTRKLYDPPVFPPSLQRLVIEHWNGDEACFLEEAVIPETLLSLTLEEGFLRKLPTLPKGLVYLRLGKGTKTLAKEELPKALHVLSIDWGVVIPESLPEGLKELRLPANYPLRIPKRVCPKGCTIYLDNQLVEKNKTILYS